MSIERFIGLAFSVGLLLLTLLVFLKPQIDYQQEIVILNAETKEVITEGLQKIDNVESEKKINSTLRSEVADLKAMSIKESDFDLFVLRVHVLSSKENASLMVDKLQNNGLIAFTEIFNKDKNLHAVYIGPFIDEADIHNNIEHIQKVSETNKGEIFRWKL
mgnify:CR=1 FL=1|jgi:hypothetical protein|tara:strand:+ start:225 stop:707 length:483 start_codon:yes stop_codon:yes gene_type:complete